MKKLIYLNLHAEAYYSGAEYDETVFITPDDYKKYFCKEEVDEDKVYETVHKTWHDKEISVGELDGKHSEVMGDVYVDLYEEPDIKEQYEKPDNDGTFLIDEMLYSAGIVQWDERQKVKEEIQKNVDKLVKEIGVYVVVSYKIPEDKVEELNTFVDNLLNREKRMAEYMEDLEEFTNIRAETNNGMQKQFRAEYYERFMKEFEKFRAEKHGIKED